MSDEGCEQHLIDALNAAEQLWELAKPREGACEHDDCLVLDGIIRDCALQIRRSIAEVERRVLETENHH